MSAVASRQDVAQILKRVERIQIVASRTVDDLFAGNYKSVFRGRGMEFDEVRPYQPGDDVRTIDWNVTARAGTPFLKRFSEERELTVIFLVDVSASGAFGSGRRAKLDLAVEVAALLMFSALRNNDKVGLVTFAEDVCDYFPPRKGKSHVLHLLRELVGVTPRAGTTRIDAALDFLGRVQRRRCVAFLVSDMLASLPDRSLAVCRARHDLIAMSVTDPRELQLPDVGFINLVDAETGAIVEIDTSNPRVRAVYQQRGLRRREHLAGELRRLGVDELPLRTDEPYTHTLRRFFHMRQQRFR